MGRILATKLDFAFVESDSLQSLENIEKMANGNFLQDTDRWEWYDRCVNEAFSTWKRFLCRGILLDVGAAVKTQRDRLRMRIQDLKDRSDKFAVHFIFCTIFERKV